MATKRKDGRQVVTFVYNGKKYYCYGKTRAEANEKANKKLSELKEKICVDKTNLSLDKYHEQWEQARYGVVKGSTIRKQHFEYNRASQCLIDEVGTKFGSLKLVDIEVQHVRALQKALQETKNDDDTPKFTTTTINGCINLIKHILNDAMRERIITWNPVCSVKELKKTERPARETHHRALTQEETKKFFETAASSYYYNVYRFMIYSGCRCGEVGALKLTDINRKEGKIQIRRTITKDAEGHYIIGKTAKTNHGNRDIPLTEELQEVINDQKKLLKILFPENVHRIDGLLFVSPEGNLLNVASVARDINRRCKKSGVEKFTSHAFRDTFATRCIESGMNPKTLQEILGHADIGITMNLYCHVMDDTKVKEMNNVKIVI